MDDVKLIESQRYFVKFRCVDLERTQILREMVKPYVAKVLLAGYRLPDDLLWFYVNQRRGHATKHGWLSSNHLSSWRPVNGEGTVYSIRIPHFATISPRSGYFEWYVLHELAHVAQCYRDGRMADHNQTFYGVLKSFLPQHCWAYEAAYKPRGTAAAGMSVDTSPSGL